MEYYVIGEDKSSAPSYTKNDVYNKDQVDSMVNGINDSLENKAGKEALSALQTTVNGKLDSSIIQDYVPKTTTVNGKELTGPIELDYQSVGAAKAEHNHDTLYYPRADINSKIADINSKIDGKASLIVLTYTNKDQATAITLPSMDTGSWLVFDCRTTDTDGSSNSNALKRTITLPGNSNNRYMLITSHSTQDSVHADIASGVYQGGITFDNSYWDGTYTIYSGATYLNGVLLRLA